MVSLGGARMLCLQDYILISKIGEIFPSRWEADVSFFCLTLILSHWLSLSLVQSNLALRSPGGRGRNLSTMGRVAVSESDHMMKGTLLWEALPWGREQWAYGASPSASNFLMEKHKQGDLINTSYSGDSHLRWTSAGSLAFLGALELLYFDFAILFPVLI